MIVGVDVHKRTHCAALIDERGVVLGTLSFPNTAAGVRKLRTWLAARDAEGAVLAWRTAPATGNCSARLSPPTALKCSTCLPDGRSATAAGTVPARAIPATPL